MRQTQLFILTLAAVLVPACALATSIINTDFENGTIDDIPGQWLECRTDRYSISTFTGTVRISDLTAVSGTKSMHLSADEDGAFALINLLPASVLDPSNLQDIVIDLKVQAGEDDGNFAFVLGQHWFEIGYSFENDRFFAKIAQAGNPSDVSILLEPERWYGLRLILHPQLETFDLLYDPDGLYLPVFTNESYSANRMSGFLGLRTHNNGATSVFIDDVSVDVYEPPMAAGDDAPTRLMESCALTVAPNPFNPVTEIVFELARSARAGIRVHDLSGRLVHEFDEREYGVGENRIIWNGTDAAGRCVASGIYVVSLSVDGNTMLSRRATLLK